MNGIEWVKAGDLRLPPSRRDVDLLKLIDQYRRFGSSVTNMPPIEVTRCMHGLLVIINGVTRAARATRFAGPDVLVPVVVIDVLPTRDVSHLPRVRDV